MHDPVWRARRLWTRLLWHLNASVHDTTHVWTLYCMYTYRFCANMHVTHSRWHISLSLFLPRNLDRRSYPQIYDSDQKLEVDVADIQVEYGGSSFDGRPPTHSTQPNPTPHLTPPLRHLHARFAGEICWLGSGTFIHCLVYASVRSK